MVLKNSRTSVRVFAFCSAGIESSRSMQIISGPALIALENKFNLLPGTKSKLLRGFMGLDSMATYFKLSIIFYEN